MKGGSFAAWSQVPAEELGSCPFVEGVGWALPSLMMHFKEMASGPKERLSSVLKLPGGLFSFRKYPHPFQRNWESTFEVEGFLKKML